MGILLFCICLYSLKFYILYKTLKNKKELLQIEQEPKVFVKFKSLIFIERNCIYLK